MSSSHYCHYVFLYSNCPLSWATRVSSGWFLRLLTHPLLWVVSCFLVQQDVQALACPTLAISYFSKMSNNFQCKRVFRSQDLGTRCPYCYWGITASRPLSVDRAREYTYLRTHTHTFISIFISLYIEKSCVHTSTSKSNPTSLSLF